MSQPVAEGVASRGEVVSRRVVRGVVVRALLVIGLLVPAASHAKRLKQGRMSFGLSGGFARSSVTVGGSFGYFVYDQLVPILSESYSWQGGDAGDAHQLRSTLELRYYILDGETVAPFVFGDLGHVFLAFRGSFDEDYNLGAGGGGAGILIRLGASVGLELGVRVGTWFAAADELFELGLLEEGVQIGGRFGLSVFL